MYRPEVSRSAQTKKSTQLRVHTHAYLAIKASISARNAAISTRKRASARSWFLHSAILKSLCCAFFEMGVIGLEGSLSLSLKRRVVPVLCANMVSVLLVEPVPQPCSFSERLLEFEHDIGVVKFLTGSILFNYNFEPAATESCFHESHCVYIYIYIYTIIAISFSLFPSDLTFSFAKVHSPCYRPYHFRPPHLSVSAQHPVHSRTAYVPRFRVSTRLSPQTWNKDEVWT